MATRTLSLVLVIALIISTAFTVGSLSLLNPSVPNIRLVRSIPRNSQPYGTLYIDVLLGIKETFYGALSLPTYFKPIANERVSVGLSNAPQATPLVVRTNSSGLTKAILPISDYYVVSINDTRFHISVPIRVLTNETTFLAIRAVRYSYFVQFGEFQNAIPTGQLVQEHSVFLKLRALSTIASANDSVFLEIGNYVALRDFIDPNVNGSVTQIPAKVLEKAPTPNGVWIELQVGRSIDFADSTQLILVKYVPTSSITIGSD